MLLVALVQVLDPPSRQARLRSLVLGFLAVETVILSYPAQIDTLPTGHWLWWSASMVPFLLLVFQLYSGFGRMILEHPPETRSLLGLVRTLTVIMWLLHPLREVLPWLGMPGTDAFLTAQAGLSVADLIAQSICATLLYVVAARKSTSSAVRPPLHVSMSMPDPS